MAVDISSVFEALLAKNKGPVSGSPGARESPIYGVSASIEGGGIDLTLTFRTGCAYCCMEWGCHLGAYETRWWNSLRQELVDRGIRGPGRLELRLTVVVEEGALFFDFSRRVSLDCVRGEYQLRPAKATEYRETVVEEDGQYFDGGGTAIADE